jgi:GAF domain-containing protein
MSCLEQKEVHDVVEVYCKKLFPKQSGVLYIFNEENGLFETVVTFGENLSLADDFASNDCWAIRMGQPFLGDRSRTNLQSQHVIEERDQEERSIYLCLPLSTREKIIGLLCINDLPLGESEELEQMAITVAERTALTIANLNLQEMLRMQILLDPLTGLYNRRYSADVLDREMHRTRRQNSTFSVVMMDLDNFKDFNDQWA